MASIEVWNDTFYVFVFDDTKLNFQLNVDGQPGGPWVTRKNRLVSWSGKYAPDRPYYGVEYYAMPCVFESLVVRHADTGEVVYDASAGEVPREVHSADLSHLPTLHILQERTGPDSWRRDRCYIPVDRYLVFDCEQLYWRRKAGKRKGWEQMQAELRQIVDVVAWAEEEEWEDHSVIRGRFFD